MANAVLLLLFLTVTARAEDLSVQWTPIPVSLSGTLDPFVLAVDGKSIEARSSAVLSLAVNNQDVKAGNGEHRPFFVSVVGDSLQVVVVTPDKREEKIPLLELPCLRAIEPEPQALRLRFCAGTTTAVWDGNLLQITGNEATVNANPTTPTHVLEIGRAGVSRSYSVQLDRVAEVSPPPERTYVGLGIPFMDWKDHGYFHFMIGRQYSSRWSLHGYLEMGAFVSGILPRFGVGGLGGYQIWRTSDRTILEMGLSIRLVLHHLNSWEIRYRNGGSLSPLSPSQHGIQMGPYLRLEPLRWGHWIFGLSLETDAFVNSFGGGGTLMFLVVEYAW